MIGLICGVLLSILCFLVVLRYQIGQSLKNSDYILDPTIELTITKDNTKVLDKRN